MRQRALERERLKQARQREREEERSRARSTKLAREHERQRQREWEAEMDKLASAYAERAESRPFAKRVRKLLTDPDFVQPTSDTARFTAMRYRIGATSTTDEPRCTDCGTACRVCNKS